jgi:hypothetical protein
MATPLMTAAHRGNDAAVWYLIAEHGVGVECVRTVVHMVVVMCCHTDAVQLLLLWTCAALDS